MPECVALPNRLQSPPKPYLGERDGTDVVRQNAFRTPLPSVAEVPEARGYQRDAIAVGHR